MIRIGATRRGLTRTPRTSLSTILGYRPVAFYDSRYSTITQADATERVSAWSDLSGNGRNLLQATAANQPILLPNATANFLKLFAAASNTVTTPSKTITGNFTLTFDLALDDYTPAADVTLVDKSSGNNGIIIKWLTTDKIRLIVGDGATLTNVDASVASGLTDFSRHTVKVIWTDGVGADFQIDGVAWGTQVAAAKTLTNAAVSLTIGSTTSAGKIYSLTATNSGATIYYLMSAAESIETSVNGATWVSSNGETYTLNTSGATPAQIVAAGHPSILFDGVAHWIQASFALVQPTTSILVWMANLLARGTYQSWVNGSAVNANFFEDFTDPSLKLNAGATATSIALPTVRTKHVSTWSFNGASSSQRMDLGASSTGDAGANNPSGVTIGATQAGGSQFAAEQVYALAVFSSALSANDAAIIIRSMATLNGIALTP